MKIFYNLNGDVDMVEIGIMVGMGTRTGQICTSNGRSSSKNLKGPK